MKISYCGLSALAASTLSACSSVPETTPDASSGDIEYGMTAEIGAGVETELCQFAKAPAGGMYISSDAVTYTAGSHHVLLFQTDYEEIPTTKDDGTPVDTTGVFDCKEGAPGMFTVRRPIGGSQSGNGEPTVQFPPGVAMHVPPGAVLLMDAHYINTSSATLRADVRVKLHTIPEAEVVEEGDVLFLYNLFIEVPARSSSQARLRCPVQHDITIYNMQSHMHARGVGFTAGLGGGDPLYAVTDWENVRSRSFGAGLTAPAGSVLDYSCDYQNHEARDVYQGTRSTDEMCMLIASYSPADRPTSWCSADPARAFETRYLGGEWVGSGTATCAATLGCVQQAAGAGDALQGMATCVVAADPSVSKEVSDGLRCLLLSNAVGKDPVVACSAEIKACLAK